MIIEDNKYANRRLRSSYISTVISISLILFTIGLLGILVLDARKISDYVKEHIQLVVFLNDDAAEVEVSGLQSLLERSPFVKSIHYVSKAEALDSLKNSLGEDALRMIESNPLPASFDINLKAMYANTDSINKLVSDISQNKIVHEVSYQQNEVGMLDKNIRNISFVILLFSALLFAIAFALINNTVRLAIYSRRFLIKSMQLVGATRGFIRRPFLKKGILNGFYGGIIACILLTILIYLLDRQFPGLIAFQDLKFMGIIYGSVICLGLVLSGISTYFAVLKYLRLKVDELYY